MPFVEHTYLYHLSRLDHRHNFSSYFYQIYLSSSQLTTANTSPVRVIKKIASSSFIPQLSLSLGLGFLLTRSRESERISSRISKSKSNSSQPNNLANIFLIQTVMFTTFNRVCTSQYFMWYLWFLPLALPSLRLSWKKGLAMLLAWVASQAIWLNYGYQLEFLGESVYRELWMASLGFFVVNVGLIWTLIGQLEP